MKWIDKCITSVISSSIASDIYVVDNGSTDGTVEYMKNNYSNVIFHKAEANLGFGKANNLGMQYAINKGYDYVYLLNQDAWVKEDTFEKLISINRLHPAFGILSPMQLTASEGFIDNQFGKLVCSWEYNKNILNDFYFSNIQDVYEVPGVMAAHWLISKECLKTVGGFSPAFPHYGEDDNYAQRARYHGFKLGIVPSTVAVHDREYRVDSKEKKSYLCYIRYIDIVSNITDTKGQYGKRIFNLFLKSMGQYSKSKSLYYLYHLVCNLSKIKKYKHTSQLKGAFLSIE